MFFLFSRFACRRLSSTFINVSIEMKRLNENQQYQKVINLFDQHIRHKRPTAMMINQALKACIALSDFKRGIEIHQNLSHQSIENPSIQINFIRLYMKHGDVQQARDIFQRSTNKTCLMYNTMLNGLAVNNQAEEALELFREMTIPPDEYIFSSIFKICAQLGDSQSIQFGQSILETAPIKYQNDTILLNSALHMLMKGGNISTSEKLFVRMNKNTSSYRIMMGGYVMNNKPQQAIDLFFQTEKKEEFIYVFFLNACAQLKSEKALALGKQVLSQLFAGYHSKNSNNEILYAALDMFVKYDDIENAESLFTRLKRNVICYGSLMKMYNLKGQSIKTLSLFEQMKIEKIKPNEIIYTLIINALSQLGDLSMCELILTQLPTNLMTNLWIQNALIDMWGKAGSVEKAKHVFETMTTPDAVSFGTMINAYGLNGMGIRAVDLFRQRPMNMENEWIYVTVLNACSHSSLIKEAQQIFHRIPDQLKTNKIYATMIDTLSRSNFVDEAEQLMKEYEKDRSPCVPMYMSILSAARNLCNTFLAQKMFDQIQLHFSDDKDHLISAMVLLANTYARNGDFSIASDIRMKLNQSGLKKIPGLSTTVVNKQIVQFRAHDRSHPRSDEIYAELDRLTKQITDHGYASDSSWITRSLTNDENVETLLCGHSERLAIAFNLIQKPVPRRIQVTKNLRVCGDCHQVTKLIARIRQCEIIVRDANRIHHFHPNGQCSCQDHF